MSNYTNKNDNVLHYMTWINDSNIDKMVINTSVNDYIDNEEWVNNSIVNTWTKELKLKKLLINDSSILELV